MVNKCARFHGDTKSGENVKFNLASAVELWETTDFVYTTFYRIPKQASNSVAHFASFAFEFFYVLFTEYASRLLLYHGAKESKDHKLQSRGPALKQRKLQSDWGPRNSGAQTQQTGYFPVLNRPFA